MIKKILFIAITSVILTGCSANLLNEDIKFAQPFYQTPDKGKVAVISKFRIDLNGSASLRRHRNSLQKAVADAIYSTGMYRKVIFGNEKIDIPKDKIDRYEIDVVTRDLGKYNWWLTWPAIYPMPFTWPLQPYRDVENKAIPIYYNGLDQLRDFVLKLNIEERNRPKVQDIKQTITHKPLEKWDGEIKNIAILNMDAFQISEHEVKALSNRLAIELFNTGRFSILERSQMDAILKEQGFQLSGCTSSECAIQAGQLLNVEQMVTGSISKIGEIFSIEVRLIDVQTGRIVAVGVKDIQGGIEDVLTPGMNKVVWNMLGRK